MSVVKEKVTHPEHYNKGKFECIDVIADQGLIKGFCLGNVLKYINRADHKGNLQLEEYRKAKFYLDYFINFLEKKEESIGFVKYSEDLNLPQTFETQE